MIVIPAIDLKDGQCVRLQQGEMSKATVFSASAADTARRWLQAGAKRLHIVDLNGAFAGRPLNAAVIKEILRVTDGTVPVQLGGGIRNLTTIADYIALGVDYIIIGTAAVTDPELVAAAARTFPGRIMVGIDAKKGLVATAGWAQVSTIRAAELAQRFEGMGVAGIIYTDISRDGMLSGVNAEETINLAAAVNIPVIASGGVRDLNDIAVLNAAKEQTIAGVIVGRALYEGTLDFTAAQALAACPPPQGTQSASSGSHF